MSLFSKLFGKKTEERKNITREVSGEERLCDWIMARMKQGPMSTEELVSHADNCPICSRTMERRRENRTPIHVEVDPEEFPTIMVFGIDGPFHLNQILFKARREDRDLVVMSYGRSPASKDPNVLLAEAPKFLRDKNLVLIFEKQPNKLDPLCLEPLVIVRRTFLLEAASGLHVRTLGKLAFRLAVIASQKNLKVSYI